MRAGPDGGQAAAHASKLSRVCRVSFVLNVNYSPFNDNLSIRPYRHPIFTPLKNDDKSRTASLYKISWFRMVKGEALSVLTGHFF